MALRPLRKVTSPARLTLADWRTALGVTAREFVKDQIPATAASAAFFALLALFPALGVLVSLYGLFGDAGAARDLVATLGGVLPAGGVSVLSEQIDRLAMAPHAGRGLAFLFSLAVSVWSANAGMRSLIAGLNVAYEQPESRGVIQLNAVSLAFTAGAIVFAMGAVGVFVAAPAVLVALGLAPLVGVSVLRWPLLLVVAAGLLSVLYRYAPAGRHKRWRWITPGGVAAAGLWMAMSLGFSLYVGRFGTYDRTYGTLGAIVGFMTWIWLSLTVVLLGAEFNAVLEGRAAGGGKA